MNHKRKRILALVLTAAVIIALPVISASAADLDLNKPVKVSFTKGPSGFNDDIDDANVVVDLYKVASAVKLEDTVPPQSMYVFTGDTYSIGVPTSYDAMQSADWPSLTQKAAKAVLLNGTTPRESAPAGAISETAAAGGIEPGLYLVVAHGSDLTTPKDYVVMNGTSVTTIANSDLYVYTYNPELIAVPSTLSKMGQDKVDHVEYDTYTDVDGNTHQGASTAGGNWQYDIKALLKPTREYRFGNVSIVKSVDIIDDGYYATFVFRVIAEKDGETVYHEYHSATLPGYSEIKIDEQIPVGATVRVTEVDQGANYTGSVTTGPQVVLPLKDKDGKEQRITFNAVNTRSNKIITGYGAQNIFEATENGGWNWYKDGDTEPRKTFGEAVAK